jgi:cytochrome c biogenesis protein
MIIGCYFTFFMSHQQLCVEVAAKGNTNRVMVAGTANKNKLAIQQKVKKISEKLANLEIKA